MLIGTVAIVGRPNVGKSTVFNRMIGERVSIVDDTPGVTRDRIYGKCEWLTKVFNVIDTGGLQIADQPFQIEIKAQVEVAIEEADTVVMLCNGKDGVTDDDRIPRNGGKLYDGLRLGGVDRCQVPVLPTQFCDKGGITRTETLKLLYGQFQGFRTGCAQRIMHPEILNICHKGFGISFVPIPFIGKSLYPFLLCEIDGKEGEDNARYG